MNLKSVTDWLIQKGYGFSFKGNENLKVIGFASLGLCTTGKITWVKNSENYERIDDLSEITIAVVQEGLELTIPNQIICPNSKEVFFAILHHFWGNECERGFIGAGTFISPEAEIDPSVYIGYNCSIVGKVKIGANSIIENNVSISHKVEIGKDCLIHSGVVIGSDGFGFAFDEKGLPIKIEHFGGVTIGDRVEIGANTCIDRGTIDDTVISDDIKINNLVHIAHNAVLQRGTVVCAGAIICGSTHFGEGSYIAPGGIVRNQLYIGNHAFVGLGAVVTKSVTDDCVVAGVPAKEIRKVRNDDK